MLHRILKRGHRSCLSLVTAFFLLAAQTSLALALTTINTAVTWTDPASLSDSLTITSTGSLRIISSGGINGGNFTLNIPNGGSFIIQSGGLLNLSALSGNGNGGNLTVNLLGTTGTIDIAGTIRSNGLGTGRGGTISLTGSEFTLANTGIITAYGGASNGLGGVVSLTKNSGVLSIPGGFQIATTGSSSATQNMITITGAGVNMDGILTADGSAANKGGKITLANNGSGSITIGSTGVASTRGGTTGTGGAGGTIQISTTTAGDISLNGGTLYASGRKGQNGGVITINARNNLNVTGDTSRMMANSEAGGTHLGNGGSVSLTAGNDILGTSTSTSQLINASAATGASTFTSSQAGNGGTVSFTAGRDISISNNTPFSTTFLISADGAPGALPGAGGTVSFSGRNLSLTNALGQASKKNLISVNGGNGRGTLAGNGGTISSNMTGTFTLENAILHANSGKNTTGIVGNMNGNAGTINLLMGGTANLNKMSLIATANGTGGDGGLIKVDSAAGAVNMSDITSIINNTSNGSGVVTLEGTSVTVDGQVNSRGQSLSSNGGTINLNAVSGGTVTVNGGVYATSNLSTGSTGDGGAVNITGGNVTLAGLGTVQTVGGYDTVSGNRGDGGVITVTTPGAFTMGATTILDSSGTPVIVTGNYTDNKISVTAGSANIDGRIQASGRYGNDSGGNINIRTTTGNIEVGSNAVITTGGDRYDRGLNPGNGGRTVLNAQAGSINVNGTIRATGDLGYDGGTIQLTAAQGILLNGQALVTAASRDGARIGRGGSITINAANFTINNNIGTQSNLIASGSRNTLGGISGNGGTINITTTGDISLLSDTTSASNALISVNGGGTSNGGNGGNVILNGNNITLQKTATGTRLMISSNTAGGQGGNITVNASGSYTSTQSDLAARNTAANGFGGAVSITSGSNMNFTDSDIFADSVDGYGGRLTLNAGGTLTTDTLSPFTTTGWGNATYNRMNITAGSMVLDNVLTAIGDSTTGGNGGTISLQSTSGDITLNDDVLTYGYTQSTLLGGSGGNVTVNAAGNYTQNSGAFIDTRSIRGANVTPLGGQNNGGNINITAGDSITLNRGGSLLMQTDGTSYTSGPNLNGGNAGNITFNATNAINLTYTGGGWPSYFQATGGQGYSSGYSGGNGGTINFNVTSGALNIDKYRPGNNFALWGGSAKLGATAGSAGSVYLNGGAMP